MNNRVMPKRPREHQLEAESRAAIRFAIPSSWIYRDLDQDYGVDGEVEIFDSSCSATGAKFLIQLKATDEPDSRKALRLWFPISKCNYYESLDLPVLITRYHAPSKALFVRWFHSLDPFYGKRTQVGVTFHLNEKDAWGIQTAARLAEEVEAYREVKSSRLRTPIRFSLCLYEEEIHGVPAYQLRLNLREAACVVQHYIIFESQESSSAVSPYSVSVTNEKIEITIGGIPCLTLHTSQGYPPELAEVCLHNDIMIGIGLALSGQGHPIEAADVIGPFWRESWLARQLETSFALARCFARANQMHRALEMSEWLFQDDSTIDAAQVLLLPFLARQGMLSTSERDLGVHVINRIIGEMARRGDKLRGASLNYSCGNILRSMSRSREAIKYYREAARLDPAYLNRPYYWSELGGILFLGCRYPMAAKAYKRSLELKQDVLTKALYADSLMFAGQYRAAEETFDEVLAPPIDPKDAEWALKLYALSWVRQITGADEQVRRKPNFPESFNPRELGDAEIERACKEALQLDALSPLSWFNLGGVCLRRGEPRHAANCFLLAALIVPWDLEAWANTIALAININDANLLGFALYTGYQRNGEVFLGHIADRFPGKPDELMARIYEIVDALPKVKEGLLVRYHGQDQSWKEVLMTPDGRVE